MKPVPFDLFIAAAILSALAGVVLGTHVERAAQKRRER